jgi:hypothetical protein
LIGVGSPSRVTAAPWPGEAKMHKLVVGGLLVGIVVLLGWQWASQSEAVYYAIFHVKDVLHSRSNAWSIPSGADLIKDKAPVRIIAQIVLSILLAAVSLLVILSKSYGPKQQHWAYGTIGALLGFWLKV